MKPDFTVQMRQMDQALQAREKQADSMARIREEEEVCYYFVSTENIRQANESNWQKRIREEVEQRIRKEYEEKLKREEDRMKKEREDLQVCGTLMVPVLMAYMSRFTLVALSCSTMVRKQSTVARILRQTGRHRGRAARP